ncbi:MAG: phospholipase, partial [Bacteroidetes bacterium]
NVPNIELKYSVIPEWSGGYVSFARVEHCKFIVVDGSSFWLGTSNCEKSYFYTSRNLGIVVRNARLAGQMQSIFLKSWSGKYVELIAPDGEYTPREHGERK